jgi:hypothetical protein
MSDLKKPASGSDPEIPPPPEILPPEDQDKPSKGPSLFLLYAILAFIMLLAMGVAALIVLPFYRRR